MEVLYTDKNNGRKYSLVKINDWLVMLKDIETKIIVNVTKGDFRYNYEKIGGK
jgi:hypothetical protein